MGFDDDLVEPVSAETRAEGDEYAELGARIEAGRAEVDTLGSDVATTGFDRRFATSRPNGDGRCSRPAGIPAC